MTAPTPRIPPDPLPAPALAFVSLGMVVLDEIRFPDGRILRDIPGGSGFYGTLGARLAVPQDESATVCCLITAGSDFPFSVREKIEEWGVSVHLEQVPGARSTRGLLEYENDAFGKKTFRYTTPPLHPTVDRLPASLLESSVVHVLATPEDLERHVSALMARRAGADSPHPLVAWEPSPIGISDREDDHMRAVGWSDVCSPNDHELLRMMGVEEGPGIPYNRALVEVFAVRLARGGGGGGGEDLPGGPSAPDTSDRRITVIRCGDQGCLTVRRGGSPVWRPPFHDYGSPKVVDPTGAGNAFLGAFAVAFAKTGDDALASAWGAVAASFVIEQIGPPKKEVVNGKEVWNGERFEDRLEKYKAKVAT
ncbi:PfkB family carbohydrate kinase [Colletotrichum navitas]|uniref:PfkB family carbohydrate kinase n=1 Tax=Colletotrichum navitas TaxID=681940 RepID=A0AAD8PXG1_9PEZI|nr:PfkB family carbohydrate kinase [Colletotrichum navitas]KAK1589865.1 PfkB family carbohydrate kinase [Colletotrichum navitas]